MSGGGAGVGSPETDMPQYIKTQHEAWLGEFDTYFDAALAAGSPYANTEAFDPNELLDQSQTRYEVFDDVVTALDPTADYVAFAAQAATTADATLSDSSDVDDLTDTFEEKAQQVLFRAQSRFSGVMSERMAHNSSAFVLGQVLLERGFNVDVADYRAGETARISRERTAFITQSISDMMALQSMQVSAHQSSTHTQGEFNRLTALANKEFVAEDIEMRGSDAIWELELFQHGSNLISGISGVALIPKAPNLRASTISGALSGAAMGGSLISAAGLSPLTGAAALGLTLLGGRGGRLGAQ